MSNKFKQGSHYCRTPVFSKKAGKVWTCKCGASFTCKEVKGRLVWLQVSDGRWK